MSRDFDVVIVGAGAIGATMAALLLARRQVSPGRVALVAARVEGERVRGEGVQGERAQPAHVQVERTQAERVQGEGVQGEGVQGEGVQGEGVQGEGVQGEGVQGEGVQGEGVQGERVRSERVRGERVKGTGVPGTGVKGTGVQGTGVPGKGVPGEAVQGGQVHAQRDAAGHASAGADVLERGWDLRVFALSRASQRLLQLCGIWPLLPPQRVCAYERMCVWDASGAPQGAGSLTFDCAEIGEPNLGFIVDGRVLQERCLQAAVAAGAVLIEAGVETVAASEAEARIRLADGRDLRGRLLIAADGAQSRTRELSRIGTAGHAYQQDALVAHVRTAKAHQNTAWQRFLATGPLAFLPLADGRCSIVWSVAREEARRLRALDAPGFVAALDAASGGFLGAIELTTGIASFPLNLHYALDYVRPRTVLLGDAAHAVHPLAGQGLNLGLLDCATLADVLGAAGADPELLGEPRLLRRYERWRKSDNLLTAAALDGLERLFAQANPAVVRLRAAGLDAVGRLPHLRRRLAQRALGLIGDVPEFLKVEAG